MLKWLAYVRTTPYRGRWPMANRRTLRRQWWGAVSATRRACQPARTNHSNALPTTLALCPGCAFRWRTAVRQTSCPPTTAPRSRRVAEKSPYPPSQIPMNRTKSCLIVVNRESSNRALCRPSNPRCSNQAAPRHPAFPFCALCAFLRQINFSPPSDFGFRPSDLFLGWTAYVHPPHGRIGT